MAHFAVIAPPLRGHYAPLSVLAEELIARGHSVTFVHQPDARSLVDCPSAKFAAIGESSPPIASWTGPMARIKGIVGLGSVLDRMKAFTALFCSEGPALLERLQVDAIIADQLEPAGGLLGESLGLPWVSAASALPMNRERGVPPPFVPWPYDPTPKGLKRNDAGWTVTDILLRSYSRSIAAAAASLGLAKSRMEDCFSPLLQIAQIVPGFDYPRHELPGHFHYTGPWRRAEPASFEIPASLAKRTAYCSLGTLQGSRTSLFRRIAKACEAHRLRLILTHGGLAKGDDLQSLPGETLVYDWLPQRAVLDQVDVVICHAGINTVLDTLDAGVPMVALPLAFEQPGIAARVQGCGAGLMMSRRTSSRRLADGIAEVLDVESYRSRALSLSVEIEAAGGTPRAADLIESTLGISAPSEAPTMGRAARHDARDDSRSESRSGAITAS